jgi:hypothetical protein
MPSLGGASDEDEHGHISRWDYGPHGDNACHSSESRPDNCAGQVRGHVLCSPTQRLVDRRLDRETAAYGPGPRYHLGIRQRTQGVSRSREEALINPIFDTSAQRETTGQAPVPDAQDAPTSVSMVVVAGFKPFTRPGSDGA